MEQQYVVVVINSTRLPDVFGPFSTATEAIRKQDALTSEGINGYVCTLVN